MLLICTNSMHMTNPHHWFGKKKKTNKQTNMRTKCKGEVLAIYDSLGRAYLQLFNF